MTRLVPFICYPRAAPTAYHDKDHPNPYHSGNESAASFRFYFLPTRRKPFMRATSMKDVAYAFIFSAGVSQ